MTVAVLVENESDSESLIQWGVEFAAADHTELLVVVPKRTKGKQSWNGLDRADVEKNNLIKSVFEVLNRENPERFVIKQDITAGEEPSDMDRIAIDIQQVDAPDPARAFSEKVDHFGITLLVLPAREPVVAKGDQISWHQQLFAEAPCEVAVVRGLPPRGSGNVRILIASEDERDRNTETAIKRGCQLARLSEKGSITLLFVRPDDDEVAAHIAQKHLDRMVKLVPEKKLELSGKFQLADSLTAGIKQQDLDLIDLIVIGTGVRRTLASVLREGDKLDATRTSVVAFRHAVPVSHRLWSRFRTAVRRRVPQIDRDYRIALVERLQSSSAFNFDFLALISLSTLIAALGLVRDSGAVVIGAMLVAPLMTPLVAIGFSLVQGNEKLGRISTKSVVLGFTVALGIGFVVGMLLHVFAPGLEITSQMYDRGSPNLLDLIVALVSGIAGAYAMGRANLISAIPGVAIAAALVPPIATSGLSLAMGDLTLSGGALLLFGTNIVAIVLGTAVTFWAVGISSRTSKTESGQQRALLRWPRYSFTAIVIVSFFLAAEMSLYNPLDVQKESEVETMQKQLDSLQTQVQSLKGKLDSN